jgi:hypothetical protein
MASRQGKISHVSFDQLTEAGHGPERTSLALEDEKRVKTEPEEQQGAMTAKNYQDTQAKLKKLCKQMGFLAHEALVYKTKLQERVYQGKTYLHPILELLHKQVTIFQDATNTAIGHSATGGEATAAAVAALEKQFQTIPALKLISSSSTLGNTNLTLEFEEGRNIDEDIRATKSMIGKKTLLVMEGTCLDPAGYGLKGVGIDLKAYNKSTNLNEMVPALLNREAELTLLDVPDAILDLQRWAGKIKVLGPISGEQELAAAFPKSSPELRAAFNTYLRSIRADGTYDKLVDKYYPGIRRYFPEFFAAKR